ncbi:MAG TPA: 2Fe-2S iron-sulfur cluster-binding protein [Ilumatobacteraceae bacterium]|nr:2Fe-2S iron-sulfur cluster-binding protein [Ilumatobacteraceae bacterium]
MGDQIHTHHCTVVDGATSVSFDVCDGGRLLHEMIAHRCSAIAVGCRGGGCGVCRVRILDGTYTTKRMSRRHVSEADEHAGVVLACRTIPTSDLRLRCEPASVPTISA